MMNRFSSQFVFSVVLLIFWGCVFGEAKLRCLEAERSALLEIKQGLNNSGFLSSWGNEEDMKECCNWDGVHCANNSGHVVILDLSPSSLGYDDHDLPFLYGHISSSLVKLRHLIYLDLSWIGISGGIPRDIGNLSKLKYLNLSYTSMRGEIPAQFSNLSSLHVLDLGTSYSRAKSLDWLSHLSSLRYLDLSFTELGQFNDWMQVISKLPYLTHLDLCDSYLADVVPPSLSFSNSSSSLTHLGLCFNNLSVSIYRWLFNSSTNSLVYLDLRFSQLQNSILEALWNLPSLEHLDLKDNNLEGSISKAFGRLSALKHLDLSENHLDGSILGVFENITALEYLDLSYNHLDGSILGVFENITALKHLDLSLNHLEGFISVVLRNMNALEYLDLGNNMFGGEFPKYIGNITTLRTLSVGFNNLSGYLPESIGQLSELEKLDISGNLLRGVISETHFSNLYKLSHLGLSSNSHLVLNVSIDWTPPFQLRYIILGDCKMARQFPKWLQTQKNYSALDISNVGISDFIPSWFWDLSSQIDLLNLSNNQISGIVPNSSSEFGLSSKIDLSSNQFEGPVPVFLFKAASVNLSRNKFSKLDSWCDVNHTTWNNFLDISHNQLLGELPDCWSPFHNLVILVLTNNSLSGKIPFSFGSLTSIESLHLGANNLTEELPSSLKHCTGLRVLDVGENKLLGPIPTWIGENLSNLVILILRSNNLNGSMPSSLCNLSHLQLLDLSANNFSGRIPKCFSNFSAMKENGSLNKTITIQYMVEGESDEGSWGGVGEDYFDEVQFVWKGTPSEYKSTLGLVKNIDLSSNKLMGEIPEGITELVGLVALNLSRNNLSGQIPSEMGRLIWLDALDLSNNQLSGKIPSSFARLDRLPVLDLSNNNLSGKIPTSTQLQSFNATAYMGNQLCGAPLAKCQEEEPEPNKESKDEEGQDVYITKGFYVSAAIGFVIAFWGVCGSLLLIKSRRHAYFKLLNDVQDWIYVTAAVNKAKMLRMTTG